MKLDTQTAAFWVDKSGEPLEGNDGEVGDSISSVVIEAAEEEGDGGRRL